jgi:hypothetical protein
MDDREAWVELPSEAEIRRSMEADGFGLRLDPQVEEAARAERPLRWRR